MIIYVDLSVFQMLFEKSSHWSFLKAHPPHFAYEATESQRG